MMPSKNHTPKVSILLPNLNTSKYLPARFESIQAQTFTDWETIVVDSYSSDGAWELIQQYAQNDHEYSSPKLLEKEFMLD